MYYSSIKKDVDLSQLIQTWIMDDIVEIDEEIEHILRIVEQLENFGYQIDYTLFSLGK